MRIIVILFIIFGAILPVNAVCMPEDTCAAQENTINTENGISQDNIRKQSINFLPDKNNNSNQYITPKVNSEYRPSGNVFQQTPAPKNCVFGVCLP